MQKTEEKTQERPSDIVAGKVVNGKKWNLETQKWEIANYSNVIIYQLDKDGKPIQDGTFKVGRKEYPKYKIAAMYRIADSSMLKLKNKETKSCHVYLRP